MLKSPLASTLTFVPVTADVCSWVTITSTVPPTPAVPPSATPAPSADTVSLDCADTVTLPVPLPVVNSCVLSYTSASVVPSKYVTRTTALTPAVPPAATPAATLTSRLSVSAFTSISFPAVTVPPSPALTVSLKTIALTSPATPTVPAAPNPIASSISLLSSSA